MKFTATVSHASSDIIIVIVIACIERPRRNRWLQSAIYRFARDILRTYEARRVRGQASSSRLAVGLHAADSERRSCRV